MLGQAQECAFQNGLLGNAKNVNLAKLSVQVRDYYSDALRKLNSSSDRNDSQSFRKCVGDRETEKIAMYVRSQKVNFCSGL